MAHVSIMGQFAIYYTSTVDQLVTNTTKQRLCYNVHFRSRVLHASLVAVKQFSP